MESDMGQRHWSSSLRYLRYVDARRAVRLKARREAVIELAVIPSGVRLRTTPTRATRQRLSPRLRANLSTAASSSSLIRRARKLYPGEKRR